MLSESLLFTKPLVSLGAPATAGEEADAAFVAAGTPGWAAAIEMVFCGLRWSAEVTSWNYITYMAAAPTELAAAIEMVFCGLYSLA